MKTSAGVILTTGSMVLIGHSRRSVHEPKSWYDDSWTIPKGIVEPGELPFQTMMRELYEETGIEYMEYAVSPFEPEILEIYKVGSKRVIVYLALVSEDILGKRLECASNVDNSTCLWNGLSELDSFVWTTPEEAHNLVFNSQKELFGEKLLDRLQQLRKNKA